MIENNRYTPRWKKPKPDLRIVAGNPEALAKAIIARKPVTLDLAVLGARDYAAVLIALAKHHGIL